MIQTVLESGVVTVEKELWTTPIVIKRGSGKVEEVGDRRGRILRRLASSLTKLQLDGISYPMLGCMRTVIPLLPLTVECRWGFPIE